MITQSELKKILHYNPETGVFMWIAKMRDGIYPGDIAGCFNKATKYKVIGVKGKIYQSHRLAWLYMTGKLPKGQIDHINHNRSDNRFVNLRLTSHADNQKNRALSPRNKSGVNGIYFLKRIKSWHAQITVNGHTKHLGYFKDKFEAICARMSANNKHSFHGNHGRRIQGFRMEKQRE